MRIPNNLEGRVYGKLTALHLGDADATGKVQWWCQCACGNEKLIRAGNLNAGVTESCGCIKRGPKPRPAADTPAHGKPGKPVILVKLWEGIPRHKLITGFAVHTPAEGGGVYIKPIARAVKRTTVSATQARMMNELRTRGLIPEQGERSFPKWIADSGVQFEVVMRGSRELIEAEFARVALSFGTHLAPETA